MEALDNRMQSRSDGQRQRHYIAQVEENLKQRYMMKKCVNLLVSVVIVLLGATSVFYIFLHDGDGVLTFRWMTVDGTLFTSAIALVFIAVSLHEIVFYTELTARWVYFMRLASAVAESLILVVVLLSQLPVFEEHMHILRYDMFNMHILIPLLTVFSFLVNDPPVGQLTLRQHLHGLWFVSLYAVVILTLILSGAVPQQQIPYFFLDIRNMPVSLFLLSFVVIYGLSYLFSCLLSRWNRKLSWLWFQNITAGRHLAGQNR